MKKPGAPTKTDYDERRAEMVASAREYGRIEHGLTVDEAVKLRKALVSTKTDPPGLYFACVRSGRNLPPGDSGPAAVYGGYALDDEEIKKAKGIQ